MWLVLIDFHGRLINGPYQNETAPLELSIDMDGSDWYSWQAHQ